MLDLRRPLAPQAACMVPGVVLLIPVLQVCKAAAQLVLIELLQQSSMAAGLTAQAAAEPAAQLAALATPPSGCSQGQAAPSFQVPLLGPHGC